MGKKCKVTYIKHSGVLVETEKSYLLFDYWQGEIPHLNSGKDLYVFASHGHHDHYNKAIFKLENTCVNVYYILSSDIRTVDESWKLAEQVTFLDPDQDIRLGDMRIRTFLSTDEGVAFMVEKDGLKIYHAGDLHWWYWPGDSVEENEGRRQREYLHEIHKFSGEKPDIAFVVLDPRQEDKGGYGMDTFLSQVQARYVFPIHFWENYEYIRAYRERTERKYPAVCLADVRGQGQVFELEL